MTAGSPRDRKVWTAEAFRDRRGRYPVIEFLERQDPRHRATVRNKIRMVLEMTRYQATQTIGRPLVDTLRGPIKELRPTKQIRILFSWEEDDNIMLLLEGHLKKNGTVVEAAIHRAEAYLGEWKITKSSDPIDEIG